MVGQRLPLAAWRFAADSVYADPLRHRLTRREQLRRFFEDDDGLPQHTYWRTALHDPGSRTATAGYSPAGNHRPQGRVKIRVDAQDRFGR